MRAKIGPHGDFRSEATHASQNGEIGVVPQFHLVKEIYSD